VRAVKLSPTLASDRPRDVLRLLAEMVEADGLGVGDRLPAEIAIAQRLNRSRSSVREGLRQWESLGIIARNKGAGTRIVSEVSTRSVHLPLTLQIEAISLQRMLAVRRPLEVEAARIASRVASEPARQLILARSATLQAAFEAGEDWRPADFRFHAAIHDATGNPLFGKIINQIHRGFHDVYEAPFDQPHLGESTIPAHRDLARTIAAGDAAGAAAVMDAILGEVAAEAARIARDAHV
jgi:GntR family transcriptional repressor for pyruvate dehydrogenase complex